eukprot:18212-Heterococcus_DN1.PRE.5
MWKEVKALSSLPAFRGLARDFEGPLRGEFKAMYDHAEPQLLQLPGGWGREGKLDALQKLCLLRCVRADKLMSLCKSQQFSKYTNVSAALCCGHCLNDIAHGVVADYAYTHTSCTSHIHSCCSRYYYSSIAHTVTHATAQSSTAYTASAYTATAAATATATLSHYHY